LDATGAGDDQMVMNGNFQRPAACNQGTGDREIFA
jgi:hypothetical protein